MRPRLAAAAALLAISAGAPIPAQDCPNVDPPPRPALECPAIDARRPAGPGLRIFLDRRTGRVRAPTLEEIRALAAEGRPGADYLEPLEVVVYPDGMRSVDLKGAFEFRVVAKRNKDGSLSARCLPPGTAEK
jgi:hypothetical protein